MKRLLNAFSAALFFVVLIISPSDTFAQAKKRNVFQFQRSMQRAGGPTDRLSNTVIVKLKEEHLTLLDKTDQQLKDLFYPLDIVAVNPLFKAAAPANEEEKAKSVRLDLIYVVQYIPSTMDMDGTIEFLTDFHYFQYVEPYYTPAPSYIPNDTNVQPGGDLRYNLEHIQAFEAWDIEQGNSSMIIGIIDTGFEITHDDLKNQFVPGWDVAGDDADVVHPTNGHGTLVAGCASAEVDNNLGAAGTGFKCRFMPIKAASDAGDALVAGYAGIEYAVDNGCKVINLSWGGMGGYSSTFQDAINYAAITKDVTVVAAAGNADQEGDFYPAAYDNVLSVCALDTIYSPSAGKTIDIRTTFRDFSPGVLGGTYAHSVDIGACGTFLNTTNIGNGYTNQFGSSLSSPLVAGAAGLLRCKYPTMTGLQIAELLRVTADTIDFYQENLPFKDKLGKGRLNMFRALSDVTSPSIRLLSFTTNGKHGKYLLPGDTITVTLNLKNYLRKTTNLSVYMTTASSAVSVIDYVINPGMIDSMQSLLTTAFPLKFKVNASAAQNQVVTFRLGFVDPATGYNDYQYFSLSVNPSMLDIETSKILSTITPDGHIGYDANGNGSGYQYAGYSMLYEGGLMIGVNGKVSDCVRATSSPDHDFKMTLSPRFIDPAYKDVEIQNKFNDSLSGNIIGVSIEQRSYAFDQPGLDQCFIVEYQIKNNTAAIIDTLYAGLFFDWDIGVEYNRNRAGLDYPRKMGYAYSTIAGRPYAGVALLTTEELTYYAMDNSTVADASNIDPNTGNWTSASKFKSMHSGVGRSQAGMTFANGNDISHVTGAQVLNIAPGEVRTVAFAILAANNLSSLRTNTDNIRTKFIQMKTSKTPTGMVAYLCENETKNIALTPGNGNTFNFYDQITDLNKLGSGNSYVVNNASTADTLFASGADSLYESTSRVPLYINNSATARANFSTQTDNLTLPGNATLFMFSSSQNYTSLTWDYGDNNGDADITNPSHTYTTPAVYTVTLTATDNKGCSSTKQKTITASLSTSISVFPNPANDAIGFGNDIKEPGTLQVVNSIGQVLYEQAGVILSEQLQLSVQNWPEGIYTLLFKTEKKQYIEHLLIRR